MKRIVLVVGALVASFAFNAQAEPKNPIVAVKQAGRAMGYPATVQSAHVLQKLSNGSSVVVALRDDGIRTVTVSKTGQLGPWSRDLQVGPGSATQRTALFLGRGGAKADGLHRDKGFLVTAGTVVKRAGDPLSFPALTQSGKNIRTAAWHTTGADARYYLTRIDSNGTLGKTTADPSRK